MAKLSLKELSKQFSVKHPEHPKLRYTKVVSKINNMESFKLTNGKSKVINYASDTIKKNFENGKLEALKGNQRLFKGPKGEIIRIDDLEKTKEFGGGGGSGAGADVTKLAESAQCLYAALVFYVFKKQISVDQIIKPEQFKKAAQYIDTDEEYDKMVNQLPDDWIKSSILGANKLYEKYRGNQFIFHRGSRKVDQIEKSFKAINRVERAFGDLNKWSPADIYMMTKNQDVSHLAKEETLKGLNGEMLKMYNAKTCIGVSLKKIERHCKYSELNVNKSKGTTGRGIGFLDMIIKANDNATIYDSMDVYIKYGQGAKDRIQFRSFGDGDGLSGFQGEIKGETANQGKASLGPVSFIIKQHANVILPTSADVASRVRREDEKLCREIYDMAKKLGVRNLPSMEMHINMCWQQTPKWRYSKFLGLTLLTAIKSKPKATQDNIVEDIYFYAGSKSSFSAPYAKIEG